MGDYSAHFDNADTAKVWYDHENDPLIINNVNSVEIMSGGTLVLWKKEDEGRTEQGWKNWKQYNYTYFSPNGWKRFNIFNGGIS